MPKLKTHKGMKKRFKISANGKVLHKRCGSSHLMSHKSGKQVRRLRKKKHFLSRRVAIHALWRGSALIPMTCGIDGALAERSGWPAAFRREPSGPIRTEPSLPADAKTARYR
jgi:large subunit ribosomal protein L35